MCVFWIVGASPRGHMLTQREHANPTQEGHQPGNQNRKTFWLWGDSATSAKWTRAGREVCFLLSGAAGMLLHVMEVCEGDPANMGNFKETFRRDTDKHKGKSDITLTRGCTSRFKDLKCLSQADRAEGQRSISALLKERPAEPKRPATSELLSCSSKRSFSSSVEQQNLWMNVWSAIGQNPLLGVKILPIVLSNRQDQTIIQLDQKSELQPYAGFILMLLFCKYNCSVCFCWISLNW